MGVAKNRKVCIDYGKWVQVSTLNIPPEGLMVYLKQFGRVKLSRKFFKKTGDRYDILFLTNVELEQLTQHEFKEFHSIHWGIETYHRAVKLFLWDWTVYGQNFRGDLHSYFLSN